MRVVSVGGEPLAPDVAQARLVVGELPHELNEVAGRLRRLCADRVSAVNGGTRLLLVGKNAPLVLAGGAFAFALI